MARSEATWDYEFPDTELKRLLAKNYFIPLAITELQYLLEEEEDLLLLVDELTDPNPYKGVGHA